MSALSSSSAPAQRPGAIHALMAGLVDYAGLFPPAKLDMARATRAYAEYAGRPESWMLGRFIVPVSRLEEFRAAAQGLLPTQGSEDPWLISALIDGDLDENLDSIFAFNHQHAQPAQGLALIDAVEIKVPMNDAGTGPSAAFIDDALERVPEEIYPFFELPVLALPGGAMPDVRGAIAALAGTDAGAKVRTGGVTPEAIPNPGAVAEFLVACGQADVPFKATAGLHHAVRGEQALTYEPNSPRAVMHGFLNVFVAAAFVATHRVAADDARQVLEETDAGAFRFNEHALSWRGETIDLAQLERAREQFALSYGSCSFDEPVQELKQLGLL